MEHAIAILGKKREREREIVAELGRGALTRGVGEREGGPGTRNTKWMGVRGCNMIFQILTCKELISFSTPLHAQAAKEEGMLQFWMVKECLACCGGQG
jgi:hypothetical protein